MIMGGGASARLTIDASQAIAQIRALRTDLQQLGAIRRAGPDLKPLAQDARVASDAVRRLNTEIRNMGQRRAPAGQFATMRADIDDAYRSMVRLNQALSSTRGGGGNISTSLGLGRAAQDARQLQSQLTPILNTLRQIAAVRITTSFSGMQNNTRLLEANIRRLIQALQQVSRTRLNVDAGQLTNGLRAAQQQAQRLGSDLSNLGTRRISIDTGSTNAALAETGDRVRVLGDNAIDTAQQMAQAGQAIAGFGAAVVAALGLAASAFIGFEAAMRNVNSIARLSDEALADLSSQVQELSSSIGKGPTELAEGLYDIQSSGFEASEGLGILEKAAVAATAGLTDTATASRAITAVLNAYGLEATEAGNVSDLLFSIVDKGVITFTNLANNLGQVLPVAAALNVSFDEVAAAMAQLTLSGISAAQSETALAAAMRSAINPTTELQQVVQEAGFASAELAIQTVGLSGYLSLLMQASSGSTEALSQLLGTAEATTAVLALMGDGGAGLSAMMDQMSASMQGGAYAQSVFNEQAKATQFTLQQLGTSLSNLRVTIGEALAPMIDFGAESLIGTIDAITFAFDALPGPVQSALAALAAVGGVTAVAGGGFMIMLPRIVETVAAFRSLGGAAGILSKALAVLAAHPVILAFVGISAVIGVGIALWRRYTGQVEENATAMDQLAEASGKTLDIITRLNLSGNWKLADTVKAQMKAANDAIDEFNANIATTFSDVGAFANIDFSMKTQEEGIAAFIDFLRKDVAHGFRLWAEETQALGEDTAFIIDEAFKGNETIINTHGADIQNAVKQYLEYLKVDDAEKTAITNSLNELFDLYSNPNIDATALNRVIGDYITAFEQGELTTEQFNAALDSLLAGIQSGADPFGILIRSAEDMSRELDGLTEKQRDFATMLDDLRLDGMNEVADQLIVVNDLIGVVTNRNQEWANAANNAAATVGGAFADTGETYKLIANATSLSAEQTDILYQAQDRLFAKIRDGSVDAEKVTAAIRDLNAQYESGAITGDEYVAAIVEMSYNTSQFATAADGAGQSAQGFFEILNDGIDNVLAKVSQNLPEQSWLDQLLQSTGLTGAYDVDTILDDPKMPWNRPIPPPSDDALDTKDEWIAYINEVPQFSDEWNRRTEEYRQWGEEQAAINDGILEEEKQHNDDLAAEQDRRYNERKEKWERERDQRKAEIDAQRAMQQSFIQDMLSMGGIDTFPEMLNLAGVGTQYTQLAADIQHANEALANGTRIVIDNTNAIAQNAQGVMDWADKLIAAEGTWGQIDELLKNNKISLDEYRDAQQAYNDIADANARIQEDVLAIQAKQAPVIAELTDAQADYMDQLAQMPEQQQAIALGWMDANTAAQANTILTQMAAVANGEMGAAGQAAFEQMVQGAIATNPYLEAILTDLGLISRDHDGRLVFNYDDAVAAQDPIRQLTETVAALVDVLDDGKLNGSYQIDVGVEDNATGTLNDIEQNLPPSSTSTYLSADGDLPTAVDNAIRDLGILGRIKAKPIIEIGDEGVGTIDEVQSKLDKLNGKTTTHTIQIQQIGASFADAAGRAAQPEPTDEPITQLPNAGAGPDAGASSGITAMIEQYRQLAAQVTTTGTAISTFNSGPLTTVNTGFGIVGATITMFNAGPLTLLNTAFSAYLGPTILAFNAGALTTLNSAFPILGASITAFNAGPLTLLNTAFVSYLGPTITTFTANAGVAITTFTTTAGTDITTMQTTFETSVDAMGSTVNTVFVNQIPADVQSGMSAASGNISAEAGTWPGIIDGIAGAMGSSGYNAGASAGYGVANGIASAEGAAVAAATSLANAVNAALDAVIQPGSPSKVTTKLGKTIPAGLVVGQLSGEKNVYNAAATLGAAAERGLNDYLSHIRTDGDWLNDALLATPNGDKWAEAARAVWDNPQTRDALKSYMDGVIADGDFGNDMLTHLPRELRDTFAEWGEYIADGLRDASEIANEAAREAQRVERGAGGSGTKGKWYDPRAGIDHGGKRLEPELPNEGGGGTTPPGNTDAEDWSKTILKGIDTGITDAMKNAGVIADATAGSLFNEADWLARVKELGETRARDISDLFTGRTRVSDTDFILLDKYLEHYGGLKPDESILPPGNGGKPDEPGTPGDGNVTVEKGIVLPGGQRPVRMPGDARRGYDYIDRIGYGTRLDGERTGYRENQYADRMSGTQSTGRAGDIINVNPTLTPEDYGTLVDGSVDGRIGRQVFSGGRTRRMKLGGTSSRVQRGV